MPRRSPRSPRRSPTTRATIARSSSPPAGGRSRLPKPLRVLPLGDLAAYIEYSRTLDLEVNGFVQRLALAAHALQRPWVRDLVPGLGGLAVHFDPAFQGGILEAAAELVSDAMRKGLPRGEAVGRELEVPVCYDAEFAPDLEEVCEKTQLSRSEVQQRHAAAEYRVLMIGFAPGHAYLGGLDAKLAVPRRASPRASVPAGSVAIANRQAVVYPFAISGGWSVIGRTPLVIFDATRRSDQGGPSLFGPGDRVRFRSIGRDEFAALEARQ